MSGQFRGARSLCPDAAFIEHAAAPALRALPLLRFTNDREQMPSVARERRSFGRPVAKRAKGQRGAGTQVALSERDARSSREQRRSVASWE
jgi:hypothetical protein